MKNKREFGNRVIPFYGGKHPKLFEIERRCMDRDGKVIDFLDQHLPVGTGGRMIIVDNAGDDEFCSLSPRNIASNPDWWQSRGFQATIIETACGQHLSGCAAQVSQRGG